MGFLEGLTVLVLGLGDSGLAMARWCARCGAREVRVWDSREAPPQAAALAAAVPAAVLLPAGALEPEAALEGVQLVLKSPGLAPHDARIAPLLALAAARGLRVGNELGLFVQALAELEATRGYAPKILAITGTNGKTTTTAMTALLVDRAGRRVAMAGNIGPSMLTTLGEALDAEGEAAAAMPAGAPAAETAQAPARPAAEPSAAAAVVAEGGPADATGDAGGDDGAAQDAAADDGASDAATAAADADGEAAGPGLQTAPDTDEAPTPLDDEAPLPLPEAPPPAPVFAHLPEVWVLELSSFQLDGVEGFEPSAAAVLNITQDHLDWHGTMAAYAAAKGRIFGRRAVMIANRDDANVEALLRELLAPPAPAKGAKGKAPKAAPRRVVRFGLDAPRHSGDFGLVTENGMAWLVRAHESEEAPRRRRGADVAAAEDEPLHLQRLMPADALRLRGRHNAANALAALALATAIGCPLAPMLHGLREYTGEPHRLEHVASVDGIDFFDDSKGTNVGASVAAIDGLGADRLPARLVVLLGGDGKGQDFAPLAEPLRRHARAVATLGRDAAAIEAALGTLGLPLERHATLEAATRWAYAQARPGDAVLLSPACASLDMFRNYGHRGQVFVAEAQAIAAERGAIA